MHGWSDVPIEPRWQAPVEAAGRRDALRRLGVFAALLGCGLMSGRAARAAAEEAAFAATSIDDALRAIGGFEPGGTGIVLGVPDLVENGALVPVTVSSSLPGTQEICLIVDTNPNPVALRLTIPEGTEAFASMRIKVAQSGQVIAVVKAQDRLYAVSRDLKVTVGGCA
jgi:sulfur-oxidizing protein SoxY